MSSTELHTNREAHMTPTCRLRRPQLCRTGWLHSHRRYSLAALQSGKKSHTCKERTEKGQCWEFVFNPALFQVKINLPPKYAAVSLHINIFNIHIYVFTQLQNPAFYQNCYQRRKRWYTIKARNVCATSYFIKKVYTILRKSKYKTQSSTTDHTQIEV